MNERERYEGKEKQARVRAFGHMSTELSFLLTAMIAEAIFALAEAVYSVAKAINNREA